MWCDAHCHLDTLESPQQALAQAQAARVEKVIAVSEHLASVEKVAQLAKTFPQQVLCGFGIHPTYFRDYTGEVLEEALQKLEEYFEHAAVLGEVGLDYKWATTEEEKALQHTLLERQLALAAERKLPLNLHSRRALRQTMNVAIEYTKKTGATALLHWFTHSKKLIRITNEHGIFVSAGPTLLSSPQTQEVVATIRRDLLLLETDTPVHNARPEWIPRIGEVVAKLWNEPLEKVEAQVEENFWRYLQIQPS